MLSLEKEAVLDEGIAFREMISVVMMPLCLWAKVGPCRVDRLLGNSVILSSEFLMRLLLFKLCRLADHYLLVFFVNFEPLFTSLANLVSDEQFAT